METESRKDGRKGRVSMGSAGEPGVGRGITFRIALLSWLTTVATLLVFVVAIIPEQKRTFLENLDSKARGISASLQDVAASAVVTEDFSSVVDHCTEVLGADPSIDSIILTRNDGFSLIHERSGWRTGTFGPYWRPEARTARGGIETPHELGRRVFHYVWPFDYSGIEWGFIHLNLSLDAYDRSVSVVYRRTAILAVLCVALSLAMSIAYARRLVRPIRDLQRVVGKIAEGDLTVRATSRGHDEIGALARSFNGMADTLLHRDQVLGSVHFAAERFLSAKSWVEVIDPVLQRIVSATGASRVYLFRNGVREDGALVTTQVHESVAPGVSAEIDNPALRALPYEEAGFGAWIEVLGRGQTVRVTPDDLAGSARAMLIEQKIRALVIVPVFVSNEWWGFLGVDDCHDVRVWSAADLDSLGAAAEILGAAIDRERMQDELLRAKEAAEAGSLAKSRFLANMSHEIRTPITGVIGMLELLRRTQLDPKQERYVNNAVLSADALVSVIGDVLDFSKIEAGRFELDESSFSLGEVVDQAVRLFAGKADLKKIELTYWLHPSLPDRVIGDPHRVRQIIMNLIGNALKFTEKGEIAVTCRCLETGEDAVRVGFEVRDTGCGIAPEYHASIFEAFSQADGSTTRVHGGTGLGLAICQQICRLMNGDIGVESAPGQGSTFWFSVKFRLPSPAERGTSSPAHDLHGLRVLVADESAEIRGLIGEYLRAWGADAESASTSEEAIGKIRQALSRGRPFRVSVLSAELRAPDGTPLSAHVRGTPGGGGLGVVVVVGLAESTRDEASSAPCRITKPIRPSDLYDAIVETALGPEHARSLRPRDAVAAAAGGSGPLSGRRILLAEDNEINQEVATGLLAAFGCVCESVGTGHEALRAATERGFDLVLMDCQMPEMDGYEATRAIRRREAEAGRAGASRLPVIALTAHALKGDRERCLESGMDDYLTKPLEPAQLEAMLRKWLGAASSPPAIAAESRPDPTTGVPDLDYPDLLKRCMGKAELASRLMGKFLDSVPKDLAALEEAIEASDADRLCARAHTVKGTAASLSAKALRELAARIERLGRERRIDEAREVVPRLRDALDRLREASVGMPTA